MPGLPSCGEGSEGLLDERLQEDDERSSQIPCFGRLIPAIKEVLQGGCGLEGSSSPKHHTPLLGVTVGDFSFAIVSETGPRLSRGPDSMLTIPFVST